MAERDSFILPHGIDVDRFLARHWQRRALFCRAALEPGRFAVDRRLLMDVATQPRAQARLVTGRGRRRRLEHGPFDDERFASLPARDWTLLVQAMEVWLPELHELIACFPFLPHWRIDDVMVSLAGPGGGVGPHVDQYDVFLVQAAGRRRWAWGGPVHPLRPGQSLRLLSAFEPEQEALAAPGDVLYLPPGVPHDGVAMDDGCMTLSLGFRAPGVARLAERLADLAARRWSDDVEHEPRFRDAGRSSSAHDRWRLEADDLDAARDLLRALIDDDAMLAGVLGEEVTRPRFPPEPRRRWTPARLAARLADGARLERWAGSRLAWLPSGRGRALLFVDGESHRCSPAFARWLVRRDCIDTSALRRWSGDDAALGVLCELVAQGAFGIVGGRRRRAQ